MTWQIFNISSGRWLGSCSIEPDADDLAARGEIAIECSHPGNGTLALVDGKAVAIPPQPSAYHEWTGRAWAISTAAQAEKRSAEQEAVWAAIKNKRYNNLRGGIYVSSVQKWFQTDDGSRQQYTFMRTLPELPAGMQWKTMDNSFVTMSKPLLDELALKLLTDEQADFANAERHRAAMLAAANPLDYDYSTGWTATYGGAA